LNQTLTKNILFNTILNILTKSTSYVSYAFIAYFWGAKLVTDIYYLGNSYVSASSGIFVILISSIFPTVFIKARLNQTLNESRKFAGTFILCIIIPVTLISLLGIIYSTSLFSIVSKLDVKEIKNHKLPLSLFSIIMLLTVVIEFFKSYLQALNYFIIVAACYLLQSVTFLLILFYSNNIFGNSSLEASLAISMTFQILALLIFIIVKRILPLFSFKLTPLHKSMISVSLPLLLAHILTLFVTYFLDYLASGYPSGYLTIIKYAQLISFLPGLLFFTPLLEVISVKLSELYHTDINKMIIKFLDFQSIVILILMPIMCFFIFFRFEMVRIFFLRGSFNMNNVIQTSQILAIYSLTIVSSSLLQIITRLYYIMQKTFWPSVYAVFFQLITLLCCILFTNKYGFWGLPVGKIFIDLLIVLPISYWLISKYIVTFRPLKILYFSSKIFILNVFISFLIFNTVNIIFLKIGNNSIEKESLFITIFRTSISFILFVLSYFYILIKSDNTHANKILHFLKVKCFSFKQLNTTRE